MIKWPSCPSEFDTKLINKVSNRNNLPLIDKRESGGGILEIPTLREMWISKVFYLIDVVKLLTRFSVVDLLGEGQYGQVYKLEEKQNIKAKEFKLFSVFDNRKSLKKDQQPCSFALKRLHDPKKDMTNFLREMRIHAYVSLKMSNSVVPLLAIVIDRAKKEAGLLMPAYSGKTLEDEMETTRTNRNKFRILLIKRWAEGDTILEQLHEKCGIVHGDAHPGNWYIEKPGGKMLLGDFGESIARGNCLSRKEFLQRASQERLAFRFTMADGFSEKNRLGARLCFLDDVIENNIF